MEKRLNKRGQDLSIGTLILIVLGIIVLVLLILGFTIGWNNLWDRVTGLGGGSITIDDVVNSCTTLVATGAQNTYCNRFNKVKINGEDDYISCNDGRVSNRLDNPIDCDSSIQYERDFCERELTNKDFTKVKVNGQACASHGAIKNGQKTCADLDGTVIDLVGPTKATATCKLSDDSYPKNNNDVELKTKLTEGYKEDKPNNICCTP